MSEVIKDPELQKEYQIIFKRCLEAFASGQQLPKSDDHQANELIGIPATLLAAVAEPILESLGVDTITMVMTSPMDSGKKFKVTLEVLDDAEENHQSLS